MQHVLVVGPTGNLGPHLVKALIKREKDVYALIRPDSMADPAKVNPLREMGVHLVEGDLSNPVSLEHACAGKDAVISAAGGGQLMMQEALLKAAKAAGVKRFIPSEFGVDPNAAGHGACDLFDAKMAVQKMIMNSGIPYTMLYTHGFMEFWASGLGQLGNSPASGTVEVYGDGQVKAPLVSLPDIGLFTAEVLDDPEMANREVRITANVTTQEQLIATYEEVTGNKVQRKYVPKAELDLRIEQSNTPEKMGERILAQLHRSVWVNGDTMKLRPEAVEATRQYPDVPIKTLKTFFSKITAPVAR